MSDYDLCAGKAEVSTPDATLRKVLCAQPRKGHGRWHRNRQVKWRGRWKRPALLGEQIERTVEEWVDHG